ncbi:MAG: ABC transporter ATP-binding protein [Clostridiaceae bacterium]
MDNISKPSSVIKVSNLNVKYDKNTILHNINLQVSPGEIVGLLGPSGSGKTTLIKTIIGMTPPASGKVDLLGSSKPSLDLISQIGYMAQSDALYEDLTAMDNLIFFGELYGIKGKEKASELLKLVHLENESGKFVKNFSGGMKRRLSLAIALIHSPKILILDEPTVGIDPLLRKGFWDEFQRIRNEGRTIILTTHAMDEAYRCDKLFLIREGEILAEGAPEQIISSCGAKDIEEAFLFYSMKKGGQY